MKEMTNEQYLNFISDLVDDGFEKWNEGNIEHASGMNSLALRNIVLYLRSSISKVNES